MNSIINRTFLLVRTQRKVIVTQRCLLSHLTTNKYSHTLDTPIPAFQQNAHIHTTNSMKLFWEPDIKGGYNKNAKRVSRRQLILEGLKDLKQEIVMWKDEVQEKLESDPVLVFRPGWQ